MHQHKAYLQGFCKAAADAGVDPYVLVKSSGVLDSVINFYNSQDEATKRAILGGLITGTGSYLLSEGDIGNRLTKGLLGGLAGGGLTYGLDRAGAFDRMLGSGKRKFFHNYGQT